MLSECGHQESPVWWKERKRVASADPSIRATLNDRFLFYAVSSLLALPWPYLVTPFH